MMSFEKPCLVPQLEQAAEKSMLATWKESLSVEFPYLWNSVSQSAHENVKDPGECDPSATHAVLNSLVGELTGIII